MSQSKLILALAALCAVAACGDDDSTVIPTDMPVRDAQLDMTDVDMNRPDTGPRDMPPQGLCNVGTTLGNACRSDAQCTDLCFCNGSEKCQGGICVAGNAPCEDGVSCTTDVCDEDAMTCTNTGDDTICDDGNMCTGAETCDPEVGCLDGIPPNCSDGDSCTIDRCDPLMGCTNTLRDVDGDGFADSRCEGGTDCDDDPATGVTVNPDAPEICDNEVDDDCDGQPDIFDPECVPMNDTCATPRLLGASGFYPYSTVTLADDYRSDCESGTGPFLDAVFQFDLRVESDINVSSNGPLGTTVELRGPGNFVVCQDDDDPNIACDRKTSSSGSPAEFDVQRLAAGTYYIIAQSPAEGLYGLSFSATPSQPPPPSDTCDPVETPDASAGGLFAGDFTVVTDRYPALSCRSSTTNYTEAAYALNLTAPKDVTIRARATTSFGTSTTVGVAIVTDCSMASSAVACESATDATLTARPLSAGSYYILVEPNSTSAIEYELEVMVTNPVPRAMGDTCGSAIDATNNTVMVMARNLENDGGVSCGGDSPPWREAYFTVNVATRSTVRIDTSAGGVHLLAVQSTCGSTTSETVCRSGIPTSTETVTLDTGTYTVVVAVPNDAATISLTTLVTPL